MTSSRAPCPPARAIADTAEAGWLRGASGISMLRRARLRMGNMLFYRGENGLQAGEFARFGSNFVFC